MRLLTRLDNEPPNAVEGRQPTPSIQPAPPGSGGWIRRLWPFIVIHVLWDTTIGFSAFFGGGVLIGAAVLLVPATTLCTCIWWDLVPRRV